MSDKSSQEEIPKKIKDEEVVDIQPGNKVTSSSSSSSSSSSESLDNNVEGKFDYGQEKTTGRAKSTLLAIVAGSGLTFGYNMSVVNLTNNVLKYWTYSIYTCRDGTELGVPFDNCMKITWDLLGEDADYFRHVAEGGFADDVDAEDEWWKKAGNDLNLAVGLLAIGAAIAAFVGGTLADKTGRRKTLLISNIYGLVISLLFCFIEMIGAPELFIVLRVLIGFNVGISSAVGPMFLSEMSTNKNRGPNGAMFQFGITIGILIGNLTTLTWTGNRWKVWPWMLGLNAAFYALAIFLLLRSVESPMFLQAKGNIEKAKENNTLLKGPNANLNPEDKSSQENLLKVIKSVFVDKADNGSKPVLKATMVSVVLMLVQQFCGINAVMAYSGDMFSKAGLEPNIVQICVCVVSLVNVLFVPVAIKYVEKAGRKMLMIIALATQTVMLGLLTASVNLAENDDNWSYPSIAFIIIYVAAFSMGPGPIPWAFGAESIPTKYISGAQGLVVVTNWVSAFIIQYTWTPLSDGMGAYVYLIFLVVCVLGIAFTKFVAVETKGKTIAEVQMQYMKAK